MSELSENLERLKNQNPLGRININDPVGAEAMKAVAGETAALLEAIFAIAAEVESLR